MSASLLAWQSWPELVFHVLAHLERSAAQPASAFDAAYCAFVERHAGAPSERPMGQDITLLDGLLDGHRQLARVQTLAWLFADAGEALVAAEIDLGALSVEQVARPWALAALPLGEPALELLRCAALLEEPVLARLPPVSVDEAGVREVLAELTAVAPLLGELSWRPVRALCRRGRVAEGEIWTGVPSAELGVSLDHLAWQAAHEATVAEVCRLPQRVAERASEDLAVVLLARRARDAGLSAAHGRWLDALHPSVRAMAEAGPSAEQRAVLDTLLG